MKPISFSALVDFKRKVNNEQDMLPFLKPYLKRGSLVDAMLSEPGLFNPETRVLSHHYRGQVSETIYSPEQVREARILSDSFLNDPIAGALAQYGQKTSFHENMLMEWKGTKFSVPTFGEGDLIISAQELGGDIKVTSCKNEKEFVKKVESLLYLPQGGWYMENLKLKQFVICGIGRAGKLISGYYPVYHYVIERGDSRYKRAEEWYSEWTYRYLEYNFLLEQRLAA